MVKSKSDQLIIHVIDSLGIGGAERLLEVSLKLLPEYRHIVCFLYAPDVLASSLNAEKVYFLNLQSNFQLITSAFKLRRIIKKEKPLLVHSHLIKSTWLSRIATRNLCPLIFTIHNFLSEDAFKVNRLSYYVEKLTYSKKQTVLAVSNAALNDYKKWIDVNGNAQVLYNVISNKFFEAKKKDAGEYLKGLTRLVAVGNLRRQKNYSNLVKAFCYLEVENVTLDIFGSGDQGEELAELVKKYSLPVQLKGQVNNLAEILHEYDALIMPSIFEGYGIAPVEAMAIGLPVILSNLEVFHEITDSRAIFFNPHDPVSISESIRNFINLPIEEKIALGEYGKQKAKEIASQKVFQQKLKEIYLTVINQ
jgi:glycosyltransferase involved in cell wall biosynthesis